jgi:putative ABC transport system permease protein
MTQQTVDLLYADYDYLDLMGIEIVRGRNFDRNMATDEYQGYIVNEALVRRMAWGNDALGKRMESAVLSTPDGNSIVRSGKVIGVVRDFNLGSLHSPVSSLMIALSTPPHRYRFTGGTVVNMRIADGKIDEAHRFLDRKRRDFGIQSPVQLVFLEQMLSQFYQAEERTSTIFGYGATVCIVLSFLGLLGLASLMTERRTKEIGIRKVLGASVTQLVALLSEHFVQLAIIANVLAWPVAYYGLSKWLQDYPYRIDIGVVAFALSGVLSLGVTLLAVGFQAFKAASGDPILSLRSE